MYNQLRSPLKMYWLVLKLGLSTLLVYFFVVIIIWRRRRSKGCSKGTRNKTPAWGTAAKDSTATRHRDLFQSLQQNCIRNYYYYYLQQVQGAWIYSLFSWLSPWEYYDKITQKKCHSHDLIIIIIIICEGSNIDPSPGTWIPQVLCNWSNLEWFRALCAWWSSIQTSLCSCYFFDNWDTICYFLGLELG